MEELLVDEAEVLLDDVMREELDVEDAQVDEVDKLSQLSVKI